MNKTAVDLAMVVLYIVVLTVYSLRAGRKDAKTQEGYFLGGRKLHWFVIGSAIFATNVSTTQFMATSGMARTVGLAAINNDLIGALMLAVSGMFFVPIYIRSGLCTTPEFLEKRYSRGARMVFSYTFLVQSLLLMPTGFYIGGLAVLELFGFSTQHLPLICIAIGGAIGLYSVLGGLSSVVKADMIQAWLLVGGGLVITFVGVSHAGGWVALMQEYGPTHFRLMQARHSAMPWTALPGIAIASIFFAFGSVGILQKALGARNLRHAQLGMIFAAFLKLLSIPLFALPGIVSAKLYPNAVPDGAYALMIRDFLPLGISGFVMVAMLAAFMSTADSGVSAIGSVVSYDIYPSWARKPNEQTGLLIGKWASAAVIAVGVLAAPLVKYVGPIYPFILRLSGYLFVPVGVCFIFGRFNRRLNHQGALVTLVGGIALGFLYVLLSMVPILQPLLPQRIMEMHFYEILPLFFLFCVALLFGVSYLTAEPESEKLDVLSAKGEIAAELTAEAIPCWKTAKSWCLVFLVVLLALYIVF